MTVRVSEKLPYLDVTVPLRDTLTGDNPCDTLPNLSQAIEILPPVILVKNNATPGFFPKKDFLLVLNNNKKIIAVFYVKNVTVMLPSTFGKNRECHSIDFNEKERERRKKKSEKKEKK